MKAAFFKEQKQYTRADLIARLGQGDERGTNTMRKLRENGVLKPVRSPSDPKDTPELLGQDSGTGNTDFADASIYTIAFVGIVVAGGSVLKCYPKYLPDEAHPTSELTQIISVLERYHSREQFVNMFDNTSTESPFNLLAVTLFLLRDYHEHGAYTNTHDIIERNGSGEINWDKTVNNTFAILTQGRPLYVELHTKRRANDDRDFFKRLHESVLTQLSRELEEAGIFALLAVPGVDVSDEMPESLGDIDYLLYRLEGELARQYNSRKTLLLKALHAYLTHRVTLGSDEGFIAYGSNNFNLVWQEVCSSVIGNQLAVPISALPLPSGPQPGYSQTTTLQSLMDKPKWTGRDEEGEFNHIPNHTLTPDLAAIHVTNGSYKLLILDAKYYTLQLHREALLGQPGIADITKQYLYQLGFSKFVKAHGINEVRNCFLMPTDKDHVVDLGHVSLDILTGLNLENIKLRLLPAALMFDLYLRGSRMEISRLRL